MVIVDTHVHTSPYLFEPVEVLLFQMNSNRVDKATLAQHFFYWNKVDKTTATLGKNFGQEDNRYIIECSRRFPGRFSPIIQVNEEHVDAPETLRQWVKEGAEGLRLHATTRSPGKDPLAIWRTCAELGLPVTCAGNYEEFSSDEFSKIVKALPEMPIILEHLGLGKLGRDRFPTEATYPKLLSLANYPNTYLKVGGLGEICERPFPFRQPFPFNHVPSFIKMAYDAFGPSRMMWGSNSPGCSQNEGYGNTLHYLEEYLATFCDDKVKEWILGKTALSLFKFRQGVPKIS
jgi:predicted TIM-barrel fold metal-dependent hydrolase